MLFISKRLVSYLSTHLASQRSFVKTLCLCSLALLSLVAGVVTGLPNGKTAHAAGLSGPRPDYGTNCLIFYNNSLDSLGAQGATGHFFFKNSCPVPIAGNVYLYVVVSQCIYPPEPFQGQANALYYNLAGDQGGSLVNWNMTGSCTECNCPYPPPFASFTLFVGVSADDQPALYTLLNVGLYGGPYQAGVRCGASAVGSQAYG